MDSARYGGICRWFMNGSCNLGHRCNYRHDWTVIPPSQICRYFQKGTCWYGERCRYLHVLRPEADPAVASRRASVPTVSSSPSSHVAHAQPDRRGSVPALLQAEGISRQEYSGSASAVNVSSPQYDIGHYLPANIAEEQSQETHLESVQSSEVAQACASPGRNEGTSSVEAQVAGAAAACSTQGDVAEKEAFLQSKDVICGICMETVYEKPEKRHHVFGLLPNCNHSFCLQCIRTWRKTKDLGMDVVKTCPQCRVRSGFYVPNKYWVEGQAKESVIAVFKEKFRKKSCLYYARYGYCPFKTECLYRHKSSHRSSSQCPDKDDDDLDSADLLNFFLAMTLLDDDDDIDLDFPFYLSEEYDF